MSKAPGQEPGWCEQSEGQPGWGLRKQDWEEGVRDGTKGQITQGLAGTVKSWLLFCDEEPEERLGQRNDVI